MSYITVSFSGGKDSTAMLLHMMELGEHIDEVLTCDTGMEFPAMYDHISKVSEIVKDNGIKFTVLKNPESFEYLMLDKKITSDKWGEHKGYGWPTPVIRWCTKNLKTNVIDRYLKELTSREDCVHCIGLASDETKRLERESNRNKTHRHPLVEWGWTEKDCLQYCYDLGYDWGGLYKIFNRVSCWCCPLSSIGELRKLYEHYPDLWHQLEEWEGRMNTEEWGSRPQFKQSLSVADLTERFEREAYSQKCQAKLDEWGAI